jgi:hypothetical protein
MACPLRLELPISDAVNMTLCDVLALKFYGRRHVGDEQFSTLQQLCFYFGSKETFSYRALYILNYAGYNCRE